MVAGDAAWTPSLAFAWSKLALVALICVSLQSAPTLSASGEMILTLSRGPEDVETLQLTSDDLAGLPQVLIVTMHDFTDEPVSYRGPLARDVIELLALGDAEMLRFTAANDYYVDIPTADFHDYDAILAMEADGVRLARREKGPLWLMYPISDNPELADGHYMHRLIWQVVRIEPR